MRTQSISFGDQETLCVFPEERSSLEQSISILKLKGNHPVIVFTGGAIDEHLAEVTGRAIQTISKIAEDLHAVVICGATDMGVMAAIGKTRSRNQYKFPLIGIAPEELVTWKDGPDSTNFLWWGTSRQQLEPHCSHFLLVPGTKFGDESEWIADTTALVSKGHRSVTILINGDEVSRKNIELSLEQGRPVIALSRTGRLADDYSRQPERNKLISVAPANSESRIIELMHAALSVPEKSVASASLASTV
jgi:predicted Rossmann-fold nucleotide-binding protein